MKKALKGIVGLFAFVLTGGALVLIFGIILNAGDDQLRPEIVAMKEQYTPPTAEEKRALTFLRENEAEIKNAQERAEKVFTGQTAYLSKHDFEQHEAALDEWTKTDAVTLKKIEMLFTYPDYVNEFDQSKMLKSYSYKLLSVYRLRALALSYSMHKRMQSDSNSEPKADDSKPNTALIDTLAELKKIDAFLSNSTKHAQPVVDMMVLVLLLKENREVVRSIAADYPDAATAAKEAAATMVTDSDLKDLRNRVMTGEMMSLMPIITFERVKLSELGLTDINALAATATPVDKTWDDVRNWFGTKFFRPNQTVNDLYAAYERELVPIEKSDNKFPARELETKAGFNIRNPVGGRIVEMVTSHLTSNWSNLVRRMDELRTPVEVAPTN